MTNIAWPRLSVFESRPDLASFRPVIARQGMISSPHAAASQIGLDILKRGGNAIDAAVATSAALMVLCPMQCGPGGDAFWMIAKSDGGMSALDASGPASRNTDLDQLRAWGMTAIPPRSPFSITVPGAVDGWVQALGAFGSMPLADLLEPAALLAEQGFAASRHTVASFHVAEAELRAKDALKLWRPDGTLPTLYADIRQPLLARTLRSIAASNGRSFYEGELARSIARTVGTAGGWLDENDLASYRADWVDPVATDIFGVTIHTTPPSTQGFGLLAALSRVQAVAGDRFDPETAAGVHVLVEAVADGLRLRDAQNDDRRRLSQPISNAWSALSAARFAEEFDTDRRSDCAGAASWRVTKGDTAHLAVVDATGMAVSLIQSLFFDFGSCLPVVDYGFTLQNRGAAFQLGEDGPAVLGPGIRPPSTLMPTIATRQGKPLMSLGCMGGDGQMQTQVQILVDLLAGNLDPQQAISRPRWYLDRSLSAGAVVKVEHGVHPSIVQGLRARGHVVEVLGASEEIMGHAQAIWCEGDVLVGAADPRSDGQVAAY